MTAAAPVPELALSEPAWRHEPSSAPPWLVLQQVRWQRGTGRRMHFELCADAHFGQPEVIGLFGANGAGKSTLMALIAGKADPHAGQVHVRGQCLAGVRRDQRARLVRHHPQPHLAAPQTGHARAMVLRPHDWFVAVREAWRDLWRRPAPPGGPHIFLFDEPPLEPPYGGLLFDRFASLRAQGNLVFFATHPMAAWHLQLIRGVCDRYAFLHDGRLRFIDNFDDFMADPEVADYLGALRSVLRA